MNNREWLNSLASTDIPGLNAWMDAEHTDDNPLTDNLMRGVVEHLGSEPGNGSQVGSEVDSRTQIVADINAWLSGNVGISVWLTDVVEQVRGWLDRQAAITKQQTERKWCCYEGSVQAEIDRLQRRTDELRTSYDKLKREHDNLADDLLTCNREREQLREHLGIALDHAHDICSLVDIDGNVLDVGD